MIIDDSPTEECVSQQVADGEIDPIGRIAETGEIVRLWYVKSPKLHVIHQCPARCVCGRSRCLPRSTPLLFRLGGEPLSPLGLAPGALALELLLEPLPLGEAVGEGMGLGSGGTPRRGGRRRGEGREPGIQPPSIAT